MGFVVVEGSLSVREGLCYVLLSLGIKGMPVSGRTAAWEILKTNNDVQGIIVDVDNLEVEGSKLITDLKANEQTKSLPVIVHTIQAGKEFVLKMIESGVAGYLLKPFHGETARFKLAAILDKLSDHNIQRKHIRVRPDPQEMIRVHFRSAVGSQLISGRIIDISLGGAAVELFNNAPAEALGAGIRISRLQFALGPRELCPSAFIVVLKTNVLALRFETLSPADKTALERYIFKRMSS